MLLHYFTSPVFHILFSAYHKILPLCEQMFVIITIIITNDNITVECTLWVYM